MAVQQIKIRLAKILTNWRTAVCGCTAAFMGVFIGLTVQTYWLAIRPTPIAVESITVRQPPGTKIRWLDVTLSATPVKNCLRQTQHLLFKNNPIDQEYMPLGSALNDLNFSNSSKQFDITLRLPYAMPAGDWYYVSKSVYTCIFWPGLTELTEMETSPIKVSIPPIEAAP